MSDEVKPLESEPVLLPAKTDEVDLELQQWTGQRLPMAASWDLSTSAGQSLALKCFNFPDLDLATAAGSEWEVDRIAILRAPGKVGSDGEIQEKWKACLIDPDGAILRFASPSAVDSLRKIVALKGGMAKIQFPFKIKIVAVKGDAPGPYYLLSLVE